MLQVAHTVDGQLGALGGQRLLPCGQGDEDTGKMEQQFQDWSGDLLQALRDGSSEGAPALTEGDNRSNGCANPCCHDALRARRESYPGFWPLQQGYMTYKHCPV